MQFMTIHTIERTWVACLGECLCCPSTSSVVYVCLCVNGYVCMFSSECTVWDPACVTTAGLNTVILLQAQKESEKKLEASVGVLTVVTWQTSSPQGTSRPVFALGLASLRLDFKSVPFSRGWWPCFRHANAEAFAYIVLPAALPLYWQREYIWCTVVTALPCSSFSRCVSECSARE